MKLQCKNCGSFDCVVEEVGLTCSEHILYCNVCDSQDIEEVDE